MKLSVYLASSAVLFASAACAVAPLTVEVDRVSSNAPIPEAFALCEATPDGKSTSGKNERPAISWSQAPKETKSYAVIISDPDVPADFSKAGREGMRIETNAPRQRFYHWALFDIPAAKTKIDGGNAEETPDFGVAAANDLGKYLPDPKNYGGPCPPWNDQRVHHYHFTVYALDTPSLGLPKGVTASQVAAQLGTGKHVVAQGEAVGTYTLNKELRQ